MCIRDSAKRQPGVFSQLLHRQIQIEPYLTNPGANGQRNLLGGQLTLSWLIGHVELESREVLIYLALGDLMVMGEKLVALHLGKVLAVRAAIGRAERFA